MPNPKVKPPKPFPKGQSGNPRGSSAKSRALGQLKKLTVQELSEVGSLLLDGSMDKMQALTKDKSASVLKVWMAALIVKSMQKGDASTFKTLIECIVPMKKQVELTGADGSPLEINLAARDMSDEEKAERADALARMRAEIGQD